MNKTATKILLLVLVLAMTVVCFAACGNKSGSHVITVMDGEKVLTTINVEDGKAISIESAGVDKSGYELVGLFTDAEFTTPYQLDAEVVGDLTVYAQFRQKQLYISVKAETGASTVERVSVATGAAYSVPAPTKEGYTFTGYTYLDDEENEVAFPQRGDAYPFSTSIRLTAHWDKNVYAVKLHVGDTVTEQSVEHGKTATLTNASMVGYTFVDWRLEGATAAFDATTPITSAIDLYANFTPNSYTISFARDLGLDDIKVNYGATYELTEPTAAGKEFLGFKLNGKAFAASGKYEIASDAYLTGEWEDLTYVVTFLSTDEESVELAVQSGLAYGAKAQGITVKGHEVKGYYLDKACTEAVTLATYSITADTELYVKAEAIEYTLTVKDWHEATVKVRYGATYTLIAPTDTTDEIYLDKIGTGVEQEWATFTGYTFEGAAFPVTGTYVWDTNIIVTPVTTPNPNYDLATVTFWDTVADEAFNTKKVARGSKVAKADFPVTTKEGYDFRGWYLTADFTVGSEFNENTVVDANVTAYAKYEAHAWTVTVKDTEDSGAVLFEIPVTFGAGFALPDKAALEGKKRGYTFVAYSMVPVSPYKIDSDVTIYATFTQNEATVSFFPKDLGYEDVTLHQYDALSAFLPETDPVKTGYTFKGWSLTDGGAKADYTQEVAGNIALYAIFEVNVYKITVIFSNTYSEEVEVTYGEDYELAENPSKKGATFVKYTHGGNDFARIGTYTIADNIDVVIVWSEDTSLFSENAAGKYFKERATVDDEFVYVFLTGIDYTFPGRRLSAVNATSYISMNNTLNGFRAMAATPNQDVFDLTVTPESGEVMTIKARVVENVSTIDLGESYHAMISNVSNRSLFGEPVAAADYVMTVGRADYRPEVVIENLSDKALTLAEANIEIVMNDGAMAADYTLNGSSVTFNSAAYEAAGTIKLTFKPKYALTEYNVTAPVQMVTMNDGKNVYTNADMKAYYSDPSVTKINVLRNVEAALDSNEYDISKGGHGKQMGEITLTYENNPGKVDKITVDTGTPYNDFKHGVYNRSTNNTADNVVINGNYFTIDGGKLPFIDNMHDSYGADGSEYATGGGYRIANVQTGIFLYRCAQFDGNGEAVKGYATGVATFKNLRITGNNLYDSTAKQDLGDGKAPLLKMSSAYIGMVVRGGTVSMDNVTITDTSMAFMLDGGVSGYKAPGVSDDSVVMNAVQPNETQATKLYADGMIMDNSWANSIYCYDLAYMQLLNTDIGRSCGLAIHCDDRPYGGNEPGSCGYSHLNCELTLDRYTANHLTNWVAGDEPWFVAYNMSTAAATAKDLIHNGALAATGNMIGLVDARDLDGDPGTPAIGFMNFAFIAKPVQTGDVAAWQADDNNITPGNPEDWVPVPHIDLHILDGGALCFFCTDDEMAGIASDLLPELAQYMEGYATAYGYAYGAALQSGETDENAKSAAASAAADAVSEQYNALSAIKFYDKANPFSEDATTKMQFMYLLNACKTSMANYAVNTVLGDLAAAATAYDTAVESSTNMLLLYYQELILDFGKALGTYDAMKDLPGYEEAAAEALATATRCYNALMTVGRPYTAQTQFGMQIILPLYFVNEITFPAAE